MTSNNTKRATKGVTWSAIERFLTQGVQFVISIILARLLSPSDFGLIALVLVVLNVLQTINEVGFNTALMQKIDRDELDFSTVFVMNIFLGIILYGILYAIAPLIALFFEKTELINLTRIVGLNLIITSLIVVQQTKLFIIVDFKTQTKASIVAATASGIVGIYFAYHGFGVFALVYQSLINNGLNTLLIWFLVGSRPKLQFSYSRFTRLFSFAYKLILVRMINVLFQQSFSAVIGKVFSFDQLGFFNRANSFVLLTSNNITGIVQRVSTPMLCESQYDLQYMGRILTKFMRSTAMIVFPILFGLFVLAEPLIDVLLTDKWLPAAWMLQVLCPVGIFYLISTFNRNVFNATGKTGWALKSELIKKIFFIIIIGIAIYSSFTALIVSQLIIAIIDFIIDTYYTKKQIGLTLLQQLKSISGVFIASLVMSGFVYISIVNVNSNVVKLILGFVIGFVTYSTICYTFNVCDFRTIIRLTGFDCIHLRRK